MPHTLGNTIIVSVQTQSPATLLVAKNLSYSIEDRPVLSNFSLTLKSGDCVALIGANGSGKTSLLKLLSGLLPPDTGSIHWHNKVTRTSDGLLYVGHRNALCGDLTALENLTALAALRRRACKVGLTEALACVDITGDIPCRQLSAGQRQRTTLARLVAFNTTIWLLDEPNTCLDSTGRTLLDDLVSQHVAAGGAALVSNHNEVSLTATTSQLELSVQ